MVKLAFQNYLDSIGYIVETIDKSPSSPSEDLLTAFKSGQELYGENINILLKRAEELNHYETVQAPLSWAQDSNKLFLEVKLANKFDAAGCPNPTDV